MPLTKPKQLQCRGNSFNSNNGSNGSKSGNSSPKKQSALWSAFNGFRLKEKYHNTGDCATCILLEKPIPDGPAQRLPPEVLGCIADHLRKSYIKEVAEESCEDCVIRDLAACARACRNWRDGICPNMYRCICISGDDSAELRKRMNIKYGARILLLQRTLASRPDYGASVREITLPEYNSATTPKNELTMIEKTIASLIVRCPNLERLQGMYSAFPGTTNKIHKALGSRTSLREHLWLLDLNAPMQYQESESFIRLHQNWRNLDTLVMHGRSSCDSGRGGGGGINHLAFSDIFSRLPALKRLMISRFQDYEFDDNTLLSLPTSLTHLRLEELPGLTERGLVAGFTRPAVSKALSSLALIDLEILDLSTLSTIFTHLTTLQRLTLLQTASPQPSPLQAPKKHPLSSQTLEYLHWDTLVPGPATLSLALSIHRNHFPQLRTIRTPSDHHGLLQSVCRPRASILLPFDQLLSSLHPSSSSNSYTRNLSTARCEAEARIVEARERVFMKVVLTPPASAEDEGVYEDWLGWNGSKRQWRQSTHDEKTVKFGGFMGKVGSAIEYELLPDVGGSEEAVVRVRDFLGRFEVAGEKRGLCCGEGGGGGGGGGGGKEGDHTPRPRRRIEEDKGLGFLF